MGELGGTGSPDKKDLQQTVNDQALFREFVTIVQMNAKWITRNHGDLYCNFIIRSYVASAVLGIRRHVKRNDTHSMMRVMEQMHKCASRVTYEFYLKNLLWIRTMRPGRR